MAGVKDCAWVGINRHRAVVEEFLKQLDKPGASVVIFDTETTGIAGEKTGLREEDIHLTQFSAVRYSIDSEGNLKEIESYDTYVNPMVPITEGASKATGLYNDSPEIVGAFTEQMAIRPILNFMNNGDAWMAYNAPYDLNRLFYTAKRCGIADYQPKPTLDVLPMAKNCSVLMPGKVALRVYEGKKSEYSKEERDEARFKNSHKLAAMVDKLSPGMEANFHDSLEDVRATAEVFAKCLEIYRKDYKDGDKVRTLKNAEYCSLPNRDRQTHRVLKDEFGRTQWLFNQFAIRVTTEEDPVFGKASILYDASRRCWSCTSDTASKKFFKETDMQKLEDDVVARYGAPYGVDNMEDLLRAMRKTFNDKYAIEKARFEKKTVEQEQRLEEQERQESEGNLEIF